MSRNFRQEIQRALDNWQNFAGEMSKSVDRGSLDERRHMIHVRTAMATSFADLSRLIDEARLTAVDPTVRNLLSEARQRASTLRRMISMHQARWPTVLIAGDETTYQSDSKKVRVERDAFCDWMRKSLLPRL